MYPIYHLADKKEKEKKRRRKLRWLNSRKSLLLKARIYPSDRLGLTNEKNRKACRPRQADNREKCSKKGQKSWRNLQKAPKNP